MGDDPAVDGVGAFEVVGPGVDGISVGPAVDGMGVGDGVGETVETATDVAVTAVKSTVAAAARSSSAFVAASAIALEKLPDVTAEVMVVVTAAMTELASTFWMAALSSPTSASLPVSLA